MTTCGESAFSAVMALQNAKLHPVSGAAYRRMHRARPSADARPLAIVHALCNTHWVRRRPDALPRNSAGHTAARAQRRELFKHLLHG